MYEELQIWFGYNLSDKFNWFGELRKWDLECW